MTVYLIGNPIILVNMDKVEEPSYLIRKLQGDQDLRRASNPPQLQSIDGNQPQTSYGKMDYNSNPSKYQATTVSKMRSTVTLPSCDSASKSLLVLHN